MSRKEKRKAMKKMKRKEVAEKEREDAEAKLNDPAEQEKLKEIEEEEAKKRDKESKEFEDSERAWREAMEVKRRKRGASRSDEKNKVKVPKKPVAAQVDVNEIVDRPTSNPLPPGIEAFSKYQNFSSAQQILDTEQDKAHCPFHLKTGACRFGPRCSRVHFHPDKSCTILMKNMYNGPGIAWEQEDEGLEYTDEEAEHFYEEFYEDVTEFQKYGELINFKTCSRGSACNFIHGFLNPGGDYEWADHDKPPPRFWIRKMTALFGYSDEYVKHMEFEYSGSLTDFRSDQPTDSHRQLSRRSRSRDHDHFNVGSKPCHRNSKNHCDSTRGHKLSRHEEKRHGGDESPKSTRDGSLEKEIYKERRKESMGGIPLMILLLEMTVAGERRVTDGKAQSVMVEEAQIQKLKNGWRMKRTREPIGLVLTGEQEEKSIEKDHQSDQEESHAHDRVVHADKSHLERWKHGHERSTAQDFHTRSERILTEAGKETMP
ncbi:hypothetical protein HID58_021204 [Brassica napus]|uniref:C3H1-type domain-containing protein n=1 Tax=Brassica napus TaxID=3708 RepID=A0ABQ8CY55_BRANA|nr:hypothetical protein HID58_021204 [Brassica napus]